MNEIRLGRILGIEVSVDPSWLVVVFLFGWSFYARFADLFPEAAGPVVMVTAAVTTLVFFASVLLHEISHSLVARGRGVPVEGITLFLFGGVSRMKMEAPRPRDEFLIAFVGPATSFVIAGVLWGVAALVEGSVAPVVLEATRSLAGLNLLLGAFNLLPGFPLDGGRVLRSILWARSGSQARATRGAARAGSVIATLMIAVGLFFVFAGDLSGLWTAAIGWFLMQAAAGANQEVMLRSALEDVTAAELMSPDPVSIPFGATIREAVDDYFLRYDHSAFPVVSEERTGLLTLRAVRQIPRDYWDVRQVWSAMTDLSDLATVPPDAAMTEVLAELRDDAESRVLVVDDGRIVGIITPRDVARWVRRVHELGLAREDEVRPAGGDAAG